MKVLFISPNSPFESIGGIERYVLNLINYYKVQTEVEFFLILPTKEKSHIYKEGNVTIYYDSSLSVSGDKSVDQIEIVDKARLFAELVEKIIKEVGINIICAENIMFSTPASYSLWLNMIANTYKIPLVLRLHMYPASDLQIALTTQLLWNKISCVSRSVASDCFQKGIDINKLSTDYLGVNTENFNMLRDNTYNLRERLHLSDDTKIILTASRIIRGSQNILKEKGIINLIQSFAKLSIRYPKLHLVIGVGKATETLKNHFTSAYEMLLGYIKIHNIEAQTTVKMFGLDEMPSVYKQSNLFVLTSEKHETFGQTFIESMACGLPVIGANTGGIPEIISDSYNGYLVLSDDSSILAQRIESLIKNDIIRDRFIRAGLKTVADNFTADKQFLNFQKQLEDTKF
ncbi:MAG TPA: glycosyltransferase family 4 protein [Candidatus Saccharimonadales bacterium]|nr:glycosyltransferase family 4 protein [Candidatus Saccharimonadales bacterium]